MPEEVVSDTSPIQYLHQVGCLDLLPALYGSIYLPEAVAAELDVGLARGVKLPKIDHLDWIRIGPAPNRELSPEGVDLGMGEREVLSMSLDRPGALALLDDALARRIAGSLGIAFTGTLGVLLKAKTSQHLPSVRPVLDHLQKSGFWLADATRLAVLRLAGEE